MQQIPLAIIQATVLLTQELVVRIHLPGTQHAKQAQLNIEPQKLSLSVAGKYNLQLSLPHKVAGAEGTASFHSGKQQLEVVLPVVPPPIPADRPNTARGTTQQQPCRVNTQSDDGGVGDAHELIESMDEAVSTATSSAYIAPAAEAAANELPSMNHSQQHSSRDREATAQQERTKPQPLTNNQQRWLDLHPKNQPSSDASMQASTSQTAVAADTDTLRAAAAAGMWE